MKIHQLPEGARFEYEGEEYVKTGPLFATGKNGRRMIPKYAVLKPLGGTEAVPPPAKTDTLPRAKVLAAFEAYHAECLRRMPADERTALDAAHRRFLESLD
jgi:hypothetical protein